MAQLRTDAPSVLYKLRGIQSFRRDLQNLLQERKVYLAKPSSFNDPYEFFPKIRIPAPSQRTRWINKAVKERPFGVSEAEIRRRCQLLCTSARHRWNFLKEFREEDLDSSGVATFSRSIDCPVLWAHYASDHRGFAVGYRGRTDGDKEAFPAFPVLYRKIRPSLYPFGPEPNWLSILRTKSPSWKYEGEWRYVRLPEDGGSGLMDVPENAIVEVRLGLKISKWHASRVMAAARRLPDAPRVLRARLRPDTFDLEFVEVA